MRNSSEERGKGIYACMIRSEKGLITVWTKDLALWLSLPYFRFIERITLALFGAS